MRDIRKSGSVGAPGEQSPGATRPNCASQNLRVPAEEPANLVAGLLPIATVRALRGLLPERMRY